ncbi:sugar phosphate isomerase/epimerase [Amnibacterium sp. CER49]|uniref:sugar phosphate isomerase/epimerase family protein n=1 Tax=Amnibacterium sp. CER49 TaxID=3039161 RepID=UPI00244A4CE6|nr:sugar phosphate isomerase/epimerase [Amnibacterium sp. CER49]MDH2443390.1 sugar phosphate isomerase/epimerase [Amnibacterium sp. CER49]
MPGRPLSVQLYSVRGAVADDLQGSLQRLADIGFTNVELYGFVDKADQYAAALEATGLSAPSAHAPVLQYDDPAPAFEAAKRLGVGTLIDPHHPREQWTTADDVQRAAELMNRAAERASQAGLAFGYHNHWWELENRVDGTPALEVLAAELSPEVVLEVDTFWASVGGVDAPDLLRRLGDRVQLIHVKDGPISRDTRTQLPAGQGEVDVPAVLAAAPRAMRVLEFDDYDGDPFDGLAASFAWVSEHDR